MEFLNATFSADTQGLTGGSKRGANINTLPTSRNHHGRTAFISYILNSFSLHFAFNYSSSTSTVDHVVIQDLVEVVRGHSARGHTRDNPSVLAGWSPVQVARDSALVIR
ncbi:hypothetical protein PC117_g16992 [Phytophthora cactorum]|uniref:Uncharacterized protein n=1 Tax=Phytophthora cactorum TaxID=29920 RepID=A0A8T1C958_9STRA|nr:hypothetical protein PC117_g16992 [Phytophthora cactorum]